LILIWNGAPATQIDMRTLTDEHIAGGDDIGHRRSSWMIADQPDGDGNMIGRIPIGDRQQSMQAEQHLGPAIVVCWAFRNPPSEQGEIETDRVSA
jgi:hypothetical protein